MWLYSSSGLLSPDMRQPLRSQSFKHRPRPLIEVKKSTIEDVPSERRRSTPTISRRCSLVHRWASHFVPRSSVDSRSSWLSEVHMSVSRVFLSLLKTARENASFLALVSSSEGFSSGRRRQTMLCGPSLNSTRSIHQTSPRCFRQLINCVNALEQIPASYREIYKSSRIIVDLGASRNLAQTSGQRPNQPASLKKNS